MRISEMFSAVQGEGPEIGYPTVFLRLSGCNLNCPFCDSKYHINGKQMTVEEVKKQILKLKPYSLTITGGEPTLQESELVQLLNDRDLRGFHKSIETNGTRITSINYDTIVISPKKEKICLDVLRKYNGKPNTYFKFVYEDVNDKWWEPVIKKCKLDRNRVYIMPEGMTRKEQLSKMEEVIEYCRLNGYKFGARLHVLAFDRKRGV